jgi:capsular exopolysaccharide synthesis family protein
MERIQKALNKARDERDGKLAGRKTPSSRISATVRATARESAIHSEEIEYSSTRHVPVSEATLRENRIIAGLKNNIDADVFRVLRTKILHVMREQGINSLAITSPTKSGGKSMVAANLAVSMAMEKNHTVLLVDLDMRRPAIHHSFGIDVGRGIADYLIDEVDLADLLVHPGLERLVLLPVGKPVSGSSELLSSKKMQQLVKEVTDRYATRIVIFDLPPLLHLDDALVFLPQVQSSILIVEEGVNTPAEVKQSLHLLEGSNLLGTVYNKARHIESSPY